MPEGKQEADSETSAETGEAEADPKRLAYLLQVAHLRHVEICLRHGLEVKNGALSRMDHQSTDGGKDE